MKRVIYYPGFEVEDINWLKFALLYLEKLEPIIPYTGDKHLSELYRRLLDGTDLLHINRPEYEEGTKANYDAIDVVEKILKNPARYVRVFNTPNVVERWRNPNKQKYLLFEEKYTDAWEHFCIKEHLAKPSHQGLLISGELAYIYMTFFAHAIGDSRGVPPMTDRRRLDLLSIMGRRATRQQEKEIDVAHGVIQLKLPANIRNIEVSEIIKFRNRRGWDKKLKAFHTEFDKFFRNVENGETSEKFVKSFGNIYKDFSDEIVKIGVGAASFGLGVWMFVNSPQITQANYIKEVLAGTSLTIGSVIGIRTTWKNTETKRYCRKYLASLGRIKATKLGGEEES